MLSTILKSRREDVFGIIKRFFGSREKLSENIRQRRSPDIFVKNKLSGEIKFVPHNGIVFLSHDENCNSSRCILPYYRSDPEQRYEVLNEHDLISGLKASIYYFKTIRKNALQ